MINWDMLQFIRPMWLWVLLLVPVLIWLFVKRHSINSSWRSSVDLHLLSYLLVGSESRQRFFPAVVLSIALVVTVVSLAGPTWSKLPQPVYLADITRMVILDLSRSMDVQDIKPSRLARAKFKVLDLFHKIKEGQTGLIVYANEPYVVSPLTEDSATIAAMVPTLMTQLMPEQGSRLDLALLKVAQLFKQTNIKNGDIIIVTDGLDHFHENTVMDIASSLKRNGHRLSVLGIGTREGAPIPLSSGGFYKDATGGIVLPKYEASLLKELVSRGGGVYVELSVDDTDVDALLSLSGVTRLLKNSDNEQTADIWFDQGFWLLFILLPLVLLVFRRGAFLMFFLVVLLPVQKPVYALGWDDVWLNKAQQAKKNMLEEKYQQAAKLFEDPEWKGAAHYRENDYQGAAEQFSKIDTPEANYNLGNALARAGKIDDALKAYQRVLDVNAEHEDAKFNKLVLEKMQRSEEEQKQQDSQEGDQQDKQKEKQSGDSKDQASSEQSKDGNEGSQSDSNNTDQDSSAENKPAENKSANAEELKNKPDKKALEEAIKQAGETEKEDKKDNVQAKMSAEQEQKVNEEKQAIEQWLSRIKDDPGGLLRQKFLLEHKRRRAQAAQGVVPETIQGDKW